MGIRARIACLGIGAVIGLTAATQFMGWRYGYQPALGWGLVVGKFEVVGEETRGPSPSSKGQRENATKPRTKIYPPWNFLVWQKKWGQNPDHQPTLKMALALLVIGIAGGAALIQLFDVPSLEGQGQGGRSNSNNYPSTSGRTRRRLRGWGSISALKKAGFWGKQSVGSGGVVFGRVAPPSLLDQLIAPKLLTSTDLRPMLVTGGTRSGKGRGIVVPSLLNWTGSAAIFDPKGELWNLISGFRASFGSTFFFNPRSPHTARFNPMAEIGTGSDAIAQVQRLVSVLCEQEVTATIVP